MKRNQRRISIALVVIILALSALSGCGSKTVTTTFTLIGDSVHGTEPHTAYETWIDAAETKVPADSSALDVIKAAMNKAGYAFMDESYIHTVITSDDRTLASGNNGENSGWIFSVNDKIAEVGMSEYKVKDGDQILLRFVDDFNTEVNWTASTFID